MCNSIISDLKERKWDLEAPLYVTRKSEGKADVLEV